MTNLPENHIGSIKYCGESIKEGMFDARKASQALIGFDEAIRFFSTIQYPKFQEIDYELPVKIRQGSWEAFIPDAITWVKVTGAMAAFMYVAKAVQKMAENDFDKVGIKTIIRKSVEAIKWVVKIGKHIETLKIKKFENVKFRNNNTEIGIVNSNGKILWVPKEFLDFYSKCPPNLLQKIVELVAEDRQLSIGSNYPIDNSFVTISNKHRHIFLTKTEDDILFPELVHGMEVTLQGVVTRGNGTANNMGFRYQEHILNVYPETGSIVQYKDTLFLDAEIKGIISRRDDKGELRLRKPKIIFNDLRTIEQKDEQLSLF